MIWLVAVPIALAVVYLAARFSRFRRWAEPILSIAVALGLVVAFIIWQFEGRQKSVDPVVQQPAAAAPALTPDNVVLSDLVYTRSDPRSSYKVTGTIHNNGAAILAYFRLTVTLEDCPGDTCRPIGTDTALVLSRIPPDRSDSFETYLTLPDRSGLGVTAPKWSYSISDVRPATSR